MKKLIFSILIFNLYLLTIKLTINNTIDTIRLFKNPDILNPIVNISAIYTINAFTRKRNIPKVRTVIGKDII